MYLLLYYQIEMKTYFGKIRQANRDRDIER